MAPQGNPPGRPRRQGRTFAHILLALTFTIIAGLITAAALMIMNEQSAMRSASAPAAGEAAPSESAPSAGAQPAQPSPPAVSAPATQESTLGRKSGGGTAAEDQSADTRSSGASTANENYNVMTVFYATDRAKTGSTEANDIYGGERGTLVLGSCNVSIPKDHRVGELEAPSIWKFEFSEDPEKHVVLLEVHEKPVSEFYQEVSARVGESPNRNAFIFVHGYNTTFRDAARRTAQMAYDLKFDGAPVFYSWPSQGTTIGYPKDETNVDWTRANLKAFIADFAKSSTADNIFLVGHSMGSRALTAVLIDLFREDPSLKSRIKEVILAAPDIDADIFKRDIAPAIAQSGALLTLYSSSKDWALEASKQFHGYQRAGDSTGGLTVVSGIDTIDSTDVDTGFLGHSYYGESKSIIADIYEIFTKKTRPDERTHLKKIDDQIGRYWKFVAGGG